MLDEIKNSNDYYPQVDGLRCVAIVAVMLEHFAHYIGTKLYAGFFGVDLFFVLSGFLITEILLKQKNVKEPKHIIKKFYIRRALRIFPIYYLMCIFFYVVLPEFKPVASYAFLYMLNWASFFTDAPIPNHVSHFWSLAVEEQFYLIWPFVVIFIPIRFLPKVFILLIGLSMFCRAYTGLDHITPSKLYELCAGGLLAFYKTNNLKNFSETIKRLKWYPLILAAIVFVIYPEFGISVLSLWLVYLGVTNSFTGAVDRFLNKKIVLHIGKVSYGIYVYHKFVAFLFIKYLFYSIWTKIDFSFLPALRWHAYIITFPISVVLAVLVATVSFKYFEHPILKLKSRFQ